MIEIKDLWHFNKVVYNYQVFGQEKEKDAIKGDDVDHYNSVISDSIFSLCPAGAGPNTLRLWESLAVGSIPVILSNKHELPDINLNGRVDWGDVVIFHDEECLDSLDEKLRGIPIDVMRTMQNLGLEVSKSMSALVTFR